MAKEYDVLIREATDKPFRVKAVPSYEAGISYINYNSFKYLWMSLVSRKQ